MFEISNVKAVDSVASVVDVKLSLGFFVYITDFVIPVEVPTTIAACCCCCSKVVSCEVFVFADDVANLKTWQTEGKEKLEVLWITKHFKIWIPIWRFVCSRRKNNNCRNFIFKSALLEVKLKTGSS